MATTGAITTIRYLPLNHQIVVQKEFVGTNELSTPPILLEILQFKILLL